MVKLKPDTKPVVWHSHVKGYVKPLPDWFDPRIYDIALEFSLDEWIRALIMRRFYRLQGRDLEYVRQHDLVYNRQFISKVPIQPHPASNRGVRSATWEQSLTLGEVLKEELKRREQFGEISPPALDAAHEVLISQRFFNGEVLAFVDLTYPDRVLEAAFSTWLKTIRAYEEAKQEPIIRNPRNWLTPTKVKTWAENRILAYLDLSAFYDKANLAVPKNGEWPYILFPGEDKKQGMSESNFRKTIKNQAVYLTSPEVTRYLFDYPAYRTGIRGVV